MSGFGIGDRFYQSSKEEPIPGPGQYVLPSNFTGKGKEGNSKFRSQNWSPAKVRAMQEQLTELLEKNDELQTLLENSRQQHEQEKDELVNLAAKQQVYIENLENEVEQYQHTENNLREELQATQNQIQTLQNEFIQKCEDVENTFREELQDAQVQIKDLESVVEKYEYGWNSLREEVRDSQVCIEKLETDVELYQDNEYSLKMDLEEAQTDITKFEFDVKEYLDTRNKLLSDLEGAHQKVQQLVDEKSQIEEILKIEAGKNYNNERSISENIQNALLIQKNKKTKIVMDIQVIDLSKVEVINSLEQQLDQYKIDVSNYRQQQSETQIQVQELLVLVNILFNQIHEKQDQMNSQQQEVRSCCDVLLDVFQNYNTTQWVISQKKYNEQSSAENSSNSSAEIQKINFNSDDEDEESNKENFGFIPTKGVMSNFTKRQFIQYHLKVKHELEELRHQCTKLLRDKIVLERQIS